MQKTRLLAGALALTALGAGLTACRPGTSEAAKHTSVHRVHGVSDAGSVVGLHEGWYPGDDQEWRHGHGNGWHQRHGQGQYRLQPMPTGTVSIGPAPDGHLQARVDMFGLTPGSDHQVSLDGPFGSSVDFPPLTANSVGQADTTLTSLNPVTSRPQHGPFTSRFVIRLGDTTGALAAEPIAMAVLPLYASPGHSFPLHAVTVSPDDAALGLPGGQATISYDAAAQTLSVTISAHGLNPGPHAAHIHLGSCENQGPVQHMLADFTADSHGDILNQTRTVAGVPSIPAPGSWYLNLHQGGMDQILANGTPTLLFRPLLCTNISSVAMTGPTATG